MKKNLFFKILGLAVMFTACSNEENLVMESVTFPSTVSLNLQSMGYDDLATVLSGTSNSERVVKLEDGTETWTVNLRKNEDIKVDEHGHNIDFFFGRTNDSISGVLSPNYATLRIQRHGELTSYVAYRDNKEMENVANYYQKQYLPTRSALIDDIVTLQEGINTRSGKTSVKCVRINTTEAIKNNPNRYSYANLNSLIPSMTSRGSDEIQRTISFVLLKEKDGNNLDHEIAWQISDTNTSIEFLVNSGIITPGFIVMDTEHQGFNDYAATALYDFQKFLRGSDAALGHGEKVYILMRNGTWDRELGMANGLGMIHLINPYSNFEITALSTSNSLHPYTLAHEIGHLLGAIHVGDKEDLMYPNQNDAQLPKHKYADNIDRILTSLQLGM